MMGLSRFSKGSSLVPSADLARVHKVLVHLSAENLTSVRAETDYGISCLDSFIDSIIEKYGISFIRNTLRVRQGDGGTLVTDSYLLHESSKDDAKRVIQRLDVACIG
jgi:hypothetical protein